MSNKNMLHLAAAVSAMMNPCRLCPRQCGCRRDAGEIGFCQVGAAGTLCKELVHYAEEPELVPTFSLYFAGCNMRCSYCSNAVMLNAQGTGEAIDHQALAARIDRAMTNGAKSIFFLGGEPLCSLRDIMIILAHVKSPAPVVWNSNMYISAPAFELILQIADVFLADLKFGCDDCAGYATPIPLFWFLFRRPAMPD